MITIMVAVIGMEIIKDKIIIRIILVMKVRVSLDKEEIVLITIGASGIGTIIVIRVILKKNSLIIIIGEDLEVTITLEIITSTETDRNHLKEIIINTKVKARDKIGEIIKIKTIIIIDSINIIIIKINHNKEETISITMIK
jgi:hypothetical protein